MLSKEDYARVYELLDSVSPLEGDCGKLCDAICCHYELYPQEKDYYLYMLLGEDSIHDKTDTWLSWYEESPSEFYMPASWGDIFYAVRCQGPDKCKRKLRPIQCRTFPLEPHITKEGKLELIYCQSKMPYKCPLISNKMKLMEDFIKVTYSAWEILVSDQTIFDYVKKESTRHNFLWHKYEVVYSPK